MTFLDGVKLIIEGLWGILCINLNFGNGISFTIWQLFAFFVVLAFISNMIWGKVSTND